MFGNINLLLTCFFAYILALRKMKMQLLNTKSLLLDSNEATSNSYNPTYHKDKRAMCNKILAKKQ
jgi:hypothetical protein